MANKTFKELKEYFNHTPNLPECVENEFMVVWDVKHCAQVNIMEIELQILKHGDNIKESRLARSAKKRLQTLFEMCEDQTTHGKPGRYKDSPFSNYRNRQ